MKIFNTLNEIEEEASKARANTADSTVFIAKCLPFIAKQLVEINRKLAAKGAGE